MSVCLLLCVFLRVYVYFLSVLSNMLHKYPTAVFHLFIDWKTESHLLTMKVCEKLQSQYATTRLTSPQIKD